MVFLVDKKKTFHLERLELLCFYYQKAIIMHHHGYMYIIYITKWFVKLHRIQKYTQILSQYFRVNECCPQMLKTFWLLNISKSKSWSKGKGGNYMVGECFFKFVHIFMQMWIVIWVIYGIFIYRLLEKQIEMRVWFIFCLGFWWNLIKEDLVINVFISPWQPGPVWRYQLVPYFILPNVYE